VEAGFYEILEQSIHEVLVWVGFGTLVGLTAKGIMPGRDPGGAIGTLMLGITGCVIGCGILVFFNPAARITPISPLGFCAATAGGFLLLLIYRVLSGSLIAEAEGNDEWMHRTRRRRRRQALARDL